MKSNGSVTPTMQSSLDSLFVNKLFFQILLLVNFPVLCVNFFDLWLHDMNWPVLKHKVTSFERITSSNFNQTKVSNHFFSKKDRNNCFLLGRKKHHEKVLLAPRRVSSRTEIKKLLLSETFKTSNVTKEIQSVKYQTCCCYGFVRKYIMALL